MAVVDNFFDRQTEASKVKATIVSKYFIGWANVLSTQKNKIGYMDLFSGPGRYNDGNPSTPLMVLEGTLKKPQFFNKVVFHFNDDNSEYATKLEKEIINFPGINKLTHKPKVSNAKIDEKAENILREMRMIPTLSFMDPWGYKRLSLPLIKALVKSWGCDSIFFLNYTRVNPAISNKVLKGPISILFTNDVLQELKAKVDGKKSKEREKIIIDTIKEVFKKWGMKFVLTFPFKNDKGTRTTHFLIFVTKHIKGFNIMKDIMGKVSSGTIQGVPTFEYNPAIVGEQAVIPGLGPLDELKSELLTDFAGSTLSFPEIYGKQIEKPFLEKNFRFALKEMEDEQLISTNRISVKKRKGSFPNEVKITFPR